MLALHVHTLGDGLDTRATGIPYAHRSGGSDVSGRRPTANVAVEIKRRREIDGVEQLTRYLDLLNRDPALAPVAGVSRRRRSNRAAAGRGPWNPLFGRWTTTRLRGVEDPTLRLF